MVALGGLIWTVFCVWLGSGEVRAHAQPGQLYSSLAYMQDLFNLDQQIGDLISRLPEHIPSVSSYLETYAGIKMDRDRGLEVTGHPIHVYTLLKRMVLYWPDFAPKLHAYAKMGEVGCKDDHMDCENWAISHECLLNRPFMIQHCPKACDFCVHSEVSTLASELLTRVAVTVFPSLSDLNGAALALSRIQLAYLIPVGTLMSGTVAGTTATIKLNVDDCMRIGNMTEIEGIYNYALIWYNYCLILAQHTQSQHQNIIQEAIQHTIEQHNTKWIPSNVNFFRVRVTPDMRLIPYKELFVDVCRGNNQPIEESWRLKCYINDRGSASLLLRPVKYEQLHYDPELYIFYDIISDIEIDIIKNISKSKLSRSTVVDLDPTENESHLSETRTSHTAWLTNDTHPALEAIAHRIADATGLFVYEGSDHKMAGEHLQVLNYGIGGHYIMHMDVLFKYASYQEFADCYPVLKEGCDYGKFAPGDRLATWMFYLSDVKAGGHTGFPYAGISVAPVKGSAAFWYNLKSNGEANQQAHHGGCPVLLGHKWVANKWIRENINFLRHPCITNE